MLYFLPLQLRLWLQKRQSHPSSHSDSVPYCDPQYDVSTELLLLFHPSHSVLVFHPLGHLSSDISCLHISVILEYSFWIKSHTSGQPRGFCSAGQGFGWLLSHEFDLLRWFAPHQYQRPHLWTSQPLFSVVCVLFMAGEQHRANPSARLWGNSLEE